MDNANEIIIDRPTNPAERTRRDELIDFIRGAGMLLVLIHHSGIPIMGSYILAFHMPLFFVLSGYTEYYRQRTVLPTFYKFVKSKFIRLMVPYFCYETVNFIAWYIYCFVNHVDISIWECLKSIILCINTSGYTGFSGRLWFLPCMFVTCCFFYAIRKYCKNKQSLFIAALSCLVISRIITSYVPFRFPMTIDTSIMALFFMICGYLFGSVIYNYLHKMDLCFDIPLILLCLIILYWSLRSDCKVYMYTNQYGDYANSITGALSGIVAFWGIIKYVYNLCEGLVFVKKIVLWYGLNSLAVFPVHLQVKAITQAILSPLNLYRWYILLVAMFLLSIPIVAVTKRLLPFMTGDCKIRKQ